MISVNDISTIVPSEIVAVTNEFSAHIYVENQLKAISEEDEDTIYQTLIDVSSVSFGANQTKFWKSKKEEFNYLRRLTYFILVEHIPSKEIVAWTGIKIFKRKQLTACYLDSSGILPAHFGKGIVPKANAIITKRAFLKRPFYDFLMFTRTENPVIYSSLVKYLGEKNVYPRLDFQSFPNKYQHMVDEILDYLKQKHLVEDNSLFIKNAYGYLDELYGELPTCSNESINEFFQSQLSSNDAFLIMGVLNYKTFLKIKL